MRKAFCRLRAGTVCSPGDLILDARYVLVERGGKKEERVSLTKCLTEAIRLNCSDYTQYRGSCQKQAGKGNGPSNTGSFGKVKEMVLLHRNEIGGSGHANRPQTGRHRSHTRTQVTPFDYSLTHSREQAGTTHISFTKVASGLGKTLPSLRPRALPGQ